MRQRQIQGQREVLAPQEACRTCGVRSYWEWPNALEVGGRSRTTYVQKSQHAHMYNQQRKGDVTLGLFSGGESYIKAVEAADYIYVPVDLQTLETSEEQMLISSDVPDGIIETVHTHILLK